MNLTKLECETLPQPSYNRFLRTKEELESTVKDIFLSYFQVREKIQDNTTKDLEAFQKRKEI